jgi:hypothetical protein
MKFDKTYIPPHLRGGHQTITWASLQCLPDWQREIWESEQLNLAETYAGYGDTYYTNKEKIGPYFFLPDGSAPLWEMGVLRLKKNYGFAVDFWESPLYEQHVKVLTYFLKRIAECVAADNILDAAQFAGTIAHHLEDSGVPGHSPDHGDLEFVKDYLTPPRKFISFPLHGFTEMDPGQFLINEYKPRLYGTTPEEAGANFFDRYVEMTLAARSLLFPMAKCAYTGNSTKAAELRRKAALMCAYVFADYMYTATCLGRQRFEEDNLRELRILKLTDRWPFRQTAWAPSPYFEPGPLMLRGINLDTDRHPVPCELLLATKTGVQSKRFKESLGSGAYFEYHYKLPAGVYARFTARVGIHAVLGAKRSVDIEVKLDGATAFKDVAQPGKPALNLALDAKGCHDIQLIASGPWLTDPDGSDNHVVWAEPRMWRNK